MAGHGVPPIRIAWAAFGRFRADEMTHHAAAMSYYGMLALFPGLLAGISVLSIFGEQSLAPHAADYVARAGAGATTAQAAEDVVSDVVRASSGASVTALVVSILLGLNGASGAFAAAGRALNSVYHVQEDRSFLKRKLDDVVAIAAVILLFLVMLIAVFLGGGIARDLFGTIGLGDTAADIWDVARWPGAMLAALFAFAIVYAYSPDRPAPRLRPFSAGTVAGVGVWIIASVGFRLYLQHFPTDHAAYGAFGAAIALLLWMWISANALLFGAELDVQLAARDVRVP